MKERKYWHEFLKNCLENVPTNKRLVENHQWKSSTKSSKTTRTTTTTTTKARNYFDEDQNQGFSDSELISYHHHHQRQITREDSIRLHPPVKVLIKPNRIRYRTRIWSPLPTTTKTTIAAAGRPAPPPVPPKPKKKFQQYPPPIIKTFGSGRKSTYAKKHFANHIWIPSNSISTSTTLPSSPQTISFSTTSSPLLSNHSANIHNNNSYNNSYNYDLASRYFWNERIYSNYDYDDDDNVSDGGGSGVAQSDPYQYQYQYYQYYSLPASPINCQKIEVEQQQQQQREEQDYYHHHHRLYQQHQQQQQQEKLEQEKLVSSGQIFRCYFLDPKSSSSSNHNNNPNNNRQLKQQEEMGEETDDTLTEVGTTKSATSEVTIGPNDDDEGTEQIKQQQQQQQQESEQEPTAAAESSNPDDPKEGKEQQQPKERAKEQEEGEEQEQIAKENDEKPKEVVEVAAEAIKKLPVSPSSVLKRSQSMPNAEKSLEEQKEMMKNCQLKKSPSRPLFSSSTFYDPEQHPTLEEQVKLCREIAKQLVSDCANAKSKGREMFERRVEKSSHWITENEDSFQNYTTQQEDYHERTISDGPPNLRLLMDPRHVDDINTLQGVNEHIIITQEAKTRDTCKNIINDLTSPEVNPNRGNVLFQKRVQKSDQWIIDDNGVAESVIDAARDKLFRNIKYPQQQQQPAIRNAYGWAPPPQQPTVWPHPNNNSWSTRSSPAGHQRMMMIPGPIFTPISPTTASSLSRPSSSMSLISGFRFKDFNAKPKPFCKAY